MAQAFNLTAQINLRGPANIKSIAADIKRQLGAIEGNVTFKIDSKSARNVGQLDSALKQLNNTFNQTQSNATAAANAIRTFHSSVGNISNVANNTSRSLQNTANATQQVSNTTAKAAKDVSNASSEMEEFGRQSALAVRRFLAFSVSAGAIYSVTGAINKGLSAFVAFDKQLVKLQQITGKSAKELSSLSAEVTKLSKNFGVSSGELVGIASTLAQAGLSARDTERALKALALTDLAPSFDSLNDTVEGSIALMRQFGIEAKDLEKALGSVNSVAAAFAVEASDLIAAIQRTGGVFASASKGVSSGTDSLNEFLAVFTSVRQTTRESAETIATGLRTIFTRIQRESTIEALREFGVTLTDLEGKFVGPFEAIKRLSEGLSSLDPRDLRFSQIVEELGGFRQIGKVIPLIQQFAVAQEALGVAQAGQGSLARDAIAAQLSLANQMSKVREEFLGLMREIGGSDTFQGLAKGALGFASVLIKVASAVKGVLPVLAVLGAGKLAGSVTQYAGGFIKGLTTGPDGKSSTQNNRQNTNVFGMSSSNQTQNNSSLREVLILTDAIRDNSSALGSSTSAIQNLTSAIGSLQSAYSGSDSGANDIVQSINQLNTTVVTGVNALGRLIQNNRGGGGTTLNGGGKVLGFARGGVVPGSGNRDTVPAMLQPGEFVIRKRAVETIGSQNLHSMNKYGSGGSVISGSSGQQRQKFADGGLAQLARLSPGMQGKTNIPTAIKRENLLQNEDVISNKIIRTRLTKQDIEKTAGNTPQFKNTIEKIRSDKYKNQNYESGLGFSFENWVFDNLKTIGLSGKYERAKTNNYPVDLIPTGNAAPVEIKYKTDSEPDPFILNKHFRYLLDTDKWKSSSFTPEINSSPPVDIGTIRVLELADGVKDDIYYPKGVSQETKLRRKEKADKRISPFYEPQTFLDGGWVERMQQQKKSSLVNAATQLEYWIDKIYAGTEEVGFSPSFKGGKNPSEQVDFKELQERLAAIDELLNAPVSSAKAKKSGLKSAGGYEPEELLDAVKLYQGGSGPLTRAMANNDLLFVDRDEQYDTEEVTNRLQAAVQYKARKKLYSGLGKSQFYETLKDTGLSEDDISDQNKVKSIVGKTIDFPTFLSTSYKKDVATAFVGDPGAMMEISTAKSKTSGIDINKAKMTADSGKPTARRLPGMDKIPKEKLFKYDDEDEFVLPPNTAFKIKKASTNKITATGDDGEEWDVVMGGSEQSDSLVDLAVQMLNKGGVARYAVGGEVQSAADKLGLGQNDRWWRGSIMGRDSIFDYASPLYAYDAINGEQYKLDQVAVQVFKKKAEKEHLDMVEARQKERQAGGSKVSAEEMAAAEAAGDFGAVLIAERDIKSQQASQRAVDSNFRGDFEKRSAGESTFRQKMTPQESRDYYTKRIRGYMAGGVTEESDISPNLQQLLDRIAAIGGPKTATELAGYPSGSMSIRKVLNKNSLLAGKNIPQAEAIVAKAEEAYRTKQNAKQSAIDAANEFALVGAYPLGYSKDYGPEDIGGLSTFFTARGLPSKYQQEIDEIAADIRDLPSRAAEKIQMKDIFGTGTRLAFDLDDTLITDADIFKPGSSADPDIPAYSDVSRVTEALKQAKLTRLGEVLRSKLTETPQLLEDIRILTARPQNNAEAVSARLTQLGLAISADKISGVSGATNKVDNLSELETLIDDRLATIEQVNKAGKSAIHYEPIKGYDPSSASGTKAAQVVEGYAIEGLMERLGVPIVEDDANRAIDYPDGLGSKARIWGVKSNVPTDVKRTMDGDAFGRFREEIERYYSENVQALASGGPVKLYHGSNSGPDDSILNSFKEKGILSNIASGYGQGSGFFMWSDKNSAVNHAKNLVDPNSNMTTSATTGGRPMVVEATETLDPKNWDLDYELQNKDIIDYIHANFDSLKPLLDKSQGVNLGDGLKNFQFRNKIDEYTDPNDNTTMRKVQIGFNDNDKEVRRTLANTTGDLRTGQVVGKLVEALRMGDPDVLDAFESDFFSNLQPGTALKYVGSSPLMPSNIETFALGGRAGLSTADTVPALLTPGEFVINKKSAQSIGYSKLNKLNKADKIQGYNKGGIVGGVRVQKFAEGGLTREEIGATSEAGFDIGDEVLKKYVSGAGRALSIFVSTVDKLSFGISGFIGSRLMDLDASWQGNISRFDALGSVLDALSTDLPGLAEEIVENGLANKRSAFGQMQLVESISNVVEDIDKSGGDWKAYLKGVKADLEANTASITGGSLEVAAWSGSQPRIDQMATDSRTTAAAQSATTSTTATKVESIPIADPKITEERDDLAAQLKEYKESLAIEQSRISTSGSASEDDKKEAISKLRYDFDVGRADLPEYRDKAKEVFRPVTSGEDLLEKYKSLNKGQLSPGADGAAEKIRKMSPEQAERLNRQEIAGVSGKARGFGSSLAADAMNTKRVIPQTFMSDEELEAQVRKLEEEFRQAVQVIEGTPIQPDTTGIEVLQKHIADIEAQIQALDQQAASASVDSSTSTSASTSTSPVGLDAQTLAKIESAKQATTAKYNDSYKTASSPDEQSSIKLQAQAEFETEANKIILATLELTAEQREEINRIQAETKEKYREEYEAASSAAEKADVRAKARIEFQKAARESVMGGGERSAGGTSPVEDATSSGSRGSKAIEEAAIRASESLEVMKLKAEANGQTLQQYQNSLKQNIVKLAQDLQKAVPDKIIDFKTLTASLTAQIRGGDNSKINDAKEALTKQLSSIAGEISPEELEKAIDGLILSVANGDKSFGDIINSSSELQKIFSDATSDTGALNNVISQLSVSTGISKEALDKLASSADLASANIYDKNLATAQKFGATLAKLSIAVGSISAVLSNSIRSFAGSEASKSNKSAAVAAAAIEGFGVTASTAGATLSQVPSALNGVIKGLQGMGGKIGGLAAAVGPKLMAALANPITAVVAILSVAALGTAAALMEAHNAAREFDKALAARNVENAMDKVSKAFEDFEKDIKRVELLDTLSEQLTVAGKNVAQGIKIDTEVPKAMWVNLFDALEGGSGAGERGKILEQNGIGAYLSTTSIFTGSQEKADFNRNSMMSEMAPAMAKQQSDQFKPVAEQTLNLFQSKLKTGTSISDIMSELQDATGAPTQLAENIARSNPVIQEQLLKIKASNRLKDEEKLALERSLIAQEAQYQSSLRLDAAFKSLQLEKLNNQISNFVTSLNRMFNQMATSIGRASYELEALSQSADLTNKSLSGQAQAGSINLSSINVLQNSGAYSLDEQKTARNQAASMFGSQSDTVEGLLRVSDKLETTILSTINRVAEEEPGANNERVAAVIRSDLNKSIRGLGLSDDLTTKLTEQVSQAFAELRGSGVDAKDISFDQLAEKVPALAKQIDIARTAQEESIKALEFWQKNLNEYAQAMNQSMEMLIESNARSRKAFDIQVKGALDLQRVLGKEITLREQVSVRLKEISNQTGGITNPTDIRTNIVDLENTRRSQQAASNSIAEKGGSGIDQFIVMQNRLKNTNMALRENYDALKNMAENTDIASAAMAKINEAQQRNQAGVNFAEKLVTSSPEELSKLNSAMGRLSNNMAGISNMGTSAEDRRGSLDAFNMIAPMLGPDQNTIKANVLESMLQESGVGVSPMMQDVLDSLRNPEEDPLMREAIETYKMGVNLQSDANTELSKLSQLTADNTADMAAEQIAQALTKVQLSFESQALDDIRKGISRLVTIEENKENNPRAAAPVELAAGGMIYASSGQMIDFTPKGTDTVPAMLTPGEFVVNRAATKRNLPLLQSMNNSSGSKVNYYEQGGEVIGIGNYAKTLSVDKTAQNNTTESNRRNTTYQISEPVVKLENISAIDKLQGQPVHALPLAYFATHPGGKITPPFFDELPSLSSYNPVATLGLAHDTIKALVGGASQGGERGGPGWIDSIIPTPSISTLQSKYKSKPVGSLVFPNELKRVFGDSLSKEKINADEDNIQKYKKAYNTLLQKINMGKKVNNYLKNQNEKPADPPDFSKMLKIDIGSKEGGRYSYPRSLTISGLAKYYPDKDSILTLNRDLAQTAVSNDDHLIGLNQSLTKGSIAGEWASFGIASLVRYSKTAGIAGMEGDMRTSLVAGTNNMKGDRDLGIPIRENTVEYKAIDQIDRPAIFDAASKGSIFYEEVKRALEILKSPDTASEESQSSKNLKKWTANLRDLYYNRVFSASFEKGLPFVSDSIAFPVTLYNMTKDAWSKKIQGQPLSAAGKTYASDPKNNDEEFISLAVNETGKLTNYKELPWTSKNFRGDIDFRAEEDEFNKNMKEKLMSVQSDVYTGNNKHLGVFEIPYNKVEGNLYDTQLRAFDDVKKSYITVSSQSGGQQNPFVDGIKNGTYYFDSIDTLSKILEANTPVYDAKENKFDFDNIPNPYEYNFIPNTAGLIPLLDKVDNAAFLNLDPLEKSSVLPSIEGAPSVVESKIIAKQFKEFREKAAINKTLQQDTQDTKRIFKADEAGLTKDQKKQKAKDNAWTVAKRVTVARKAYEAAMKNGVRLGSRMPVDIPSTGSVAAELGGGISKLPTNSMLRMQLDAWRAVFAELYNNGEKPRSAKEAAEGSDSGSFLKSLGIKTGAVGTVFTSPGPLIPVPGSTKETMPAYYNSTTNTPEDILKLVQYQFMASRAQQFAGALNEEDKEDLTVTGGKLYTVNQDGTKTLRKEEETIPKSYADIFDIGLSPENIFPDSNIRQTYLDKLINFYKTGADAQGQALFSAQMSEPYVNALTGLQTWYKTQDNVLNTSRKPEELLAIKSGLESVQQGAEPPEPISTTLADLGLDLNNIKTAFTSGRDQAQTANAFLTQNRFGELPTLKRMISLINVRASEAEVEAKATTESAETRQLAKGGVVYASTGKLINFQPRGTDTVPAMLTPGEFVVNRGATEKHLPVLQAINSGTYSHGDLVKRFNVGGLVPNGYYQTGGVASAGLAGFDFGSFMSGVIGQLTSGITEAVQNAFRSVVNANNSSGGVSSSSTSNMDGINDFTSKLERISNTLAGLDIPREIVVTGRHEVNVIINGDEALNRLSPNIKDMVMTELKNSFDKLVSLNQPVPDDSLRSPFA